MTDLQAPRDESISTAVEYESIPTAVHRFLRNPLEFTSSPVTMFDLLGKDNILCLVKVTSEEVDDGFTGAKLCYSFYALIPDTIEYVLISSKIDFTQIIGSGLSFETICLPFPDHNEGDEPYNPSKYIIPPYATAPLSEKFPRNKNPSLVDFSIFLRKNPDVDVLFFYREKESRQLVNPIMDGRNFFIPNALRSNIRTNELISMGSLDCKSEASYSLHLNGLILVGNMKKVCQIICSDPGYLDRYTKEVTETQILEYDRKNPKPTIQMQAVPKKPDWMEKMSNEEVALYVNGTRKVTWNHPLNKRALEAYIKKLNDLNIEAKRRLERAESDYVSRRNYFIKKIHNNIPSLVLQENVGLKIFWKQIVEFNKDFLGNPSMSCCIKFSNEVIEELQSQQYHHPNELTKLTDTSPMLFEFFQEANLNNYRLLIFMSLVFQMDPQRGLPSGGNIKKRYSRKNRKRYSRKNRKRYSRKNRKNRKRYSRKNRKLYSRKNRKLYSIKK